MSRRGWLRKRAVTVGLVKRLRTAPAPRPARNKHGHAMMYPDGTLILLTRHERRHP